MPAGLTSRRNEVASPAKITQRSSAAEKTKPRSTGIIFAVVTLFVLILAGGAAVYYLSNQKENNVDRLNYEKIPEEIAILDTSYSRIGWQEDAYKILTNFIAGSSVEEKLPYIANADALREKMDLFYGGVVIVDNDTPVSSFSVQKITDEDRRRGLFLLVFDQPQQFSIKDFFRPLVTMEAQFGFEEANILIRSMARKSNFAMDPLRVYAFFKRTDQGLKLDWEVFAQTKYRTFRTFTEQPDVGAVETFRVVIAENVPEKGHDIPGIRTYQITDPAHREDSIRVNVKRDSALGKELSVINWRGIQQAVPQARSATVELEWTGQPYNPVLSLKRLVCWEFLGLGGVENLATASEQ